MTVDRFDKQLNPDYRPERYVKVTFSLSRVWRVLVLYNTVMSLPIWFFIYVVLVSFGVLPQ